jgi:hypothetical protein
MKKTVFWISLIGTLSSFLTNGIVSGLTGGLTVISFLCGKGNHGCWSKIDTASLFLLVFAPLFLLSLVTYKMRDEVFRAWWNFARWWVPVIILVTYLQSTQGGGGGLGIGGAMSSGFDALVLGFFYTVLVVVSLWRIVRKYRQLKREGK